MGMLLFQTPNNFTFIVGIRHFVVRMVTKLTSEEATMRNEKVLVNKLNLVLVQVCYPFTTLIVYAPIVYIDSQTRVAA